MITNMTGDSVAPLARPAEPLVGSYFVAAYPPFSLWTPTALDVYRDRLGQPRPSLTQVPLGLYVHIPFCGERCQFCYYLSYAKKTRAQIRKEKAEQDKKDKRRRSGQRGTRKR